MDSDIVHYSQTPFQPICGADSPNQSTTQVLQDATCGRCFVLWWFDNLPVEKKKLFVRLVKQEREA